MKKFILLFLIFFSVITFAYKIWNIDYSYFANEAKLTDIIRITQSDGTVQSLPGIWNLTFSSSRRGEILQCMKESDHHNLNLCGANTYNIKKVSPRGRYIEFIWSGWEWADYKIYSITEKKIIFNYNWFYLDSRWTPDNKQLIFLTASCSIWWCDSTGVYMSQRDNFPSMNRVLSYEIQWCGFDECELSIEKLTNNNLIILVKKYDARGNPTIKFKRVTLWLSDWKIIKSQKL